MPYGSSVDTGQPLPLFLTSPGLEAAAGNNTGLLTANVVYVIAYSLLAGVTVSGGRYHNGAVTPGTTDVGIYSSDGNTKLVSSGAVTNVGSTTNTNSLIGGNYYLPAGNYYLALTCSNATDNYSVTATLAIPGSLADLRQATNAAAAGVLPSTLGAILAPAGKFPVLSFVVVGGLP